MRRIGKLIAAQILGKAFAIVGRGSVIDAIVCVLSGVRIVYVCNLAGVRILYRTVRATRAWIEPWITRRNGASTS